MERPALDEWNGPAVAPLQERDDGDVAVAVDPERKEAVVEGVGGRVGQAVPQETQALLVHLVVVHVGDL